MHVALFPDVSVAVHLTCVYPYGRVNTYRNVLPDAGVQLELATATLSDVNTDHASAFEFLPVPSGSTMLAGQMMVGGWTSVTVMVNEHPAALFDESLAVHEMVVTPSANVTVTSGSRLHVTVVDPLLSVAIGSDHATYPVAKSGVVLTP